MIGLEIEIDMIDAKGEPAMANAEFLARLGDPTFKAELGAFNLEVNVAPRLLGGHGLTEYEQELRDSLNAAQQVADRMDVHLVLTGLLPTLLPEHTIVANLSDEPRYRALNDQIIDARGDVVGLTGLLVTCVVVIVASAIRTCVIGKKPPVAPEI